MSARQRTYKTKQREFVLAYITKNAGRYLSVDEVWTGISSEGGKVGRTTVYRCLEAMAANGEALKATTPGGEARYRLMENPEGAQLVCLECGQALPLECHMVSDFSAHVLDRHGFRINTTRTVLYGLCSMCSEVA